MLSSLKWKTILMLVAMLLIVVEPFLNVVSVKADSTATQILSPTDELNVQFKNSVPDKRLSDFDNDNIISLGGAGSGLVDIYAMKFMLQPNKSIESANLVMYEGSHCGGSLYELKVLVKIGEDGWDNASVASEFPTSINDSEFEMQNIVECDAEENLYPTRIDVTRLLNLSGTITSDGKVTFIVENAGGQSLRFPGSKYEEESIRPRLEIVYGDSIPQNSAPTDISLSPLSVEENQPPNTVVGTLIATDPDEGDTFTYSLVPGSGDMDNASFNIAGNKLQTNVSFDYEAKNSYSVRIRVEDSAANTFEKSFTISVTAQKHIVDFNVDGGSTVPSQEIRHGQKVTEPTVPTKTGYTFDGWYTDTSFGTVFNFENTSITAATTVYAKWNINNYTVTFDSQDGSEVDSKNADYNTTITAPTPPTKVGYTFDGWYKEVGLINVWDFATDEITSDITLYAKWTIQKHAVDFNVDGGSLVSSQNIEHGQKATEPTDPTKTGYTFDGWYADASFDTAFDFDNTLITADTTVHAKWNINSYTVTFDSQGGSAVDSKNADYNTTITAPTDPTKIGYIFDGWYKEANWTTEWNFSTDTITSATTLYAKWIVQQYAVDFNVDGGSTVWSQNIEHGQKATEPTDPTKTGYTFDGWYADASFDTAFDFDNTPITAATIVYAKWNINNYTVTFDSQDGSLVNNQTADYNTTITAPAEPTKTGYIFDGWYKEASWTTKWNFSTDKVTSDITLYAKWTIQRYAVDFNVDGGSLVSSQNIEHGQKATEPTAPTKTGYTFDGWYTTAASGTPFDFGNTPITAATIIYAKWNINNYTVIFDSQGGSEVNNQTADYNTTITAPNEPTKTGYIFGGWYKEASWATEWNFSTDQVTSDITLYAKWTIQQYAVDFNVDGGSLVSSQNIEHGQKATEPSAPTKTGYTFDGWYTTAAFGTPFDFENTPITAATTVYAKWIINNYTVTFDSQDGSIVNSKNADYNTTITAPTPPTKVGYTFDGWYKEVGLINVWNFATDKITSDITLYAKWTIQKHAVVFNVDGGSTVSPQNIEHGQKATEPTAPTKIGYTFDGWYTDSSFQTAFDFADATIIGDTTIYAKWKIQSYSITFVSNGGSAVISQTVDYFANVTKPNNPTRSGYTFNGWYVDENLQHSYSFATKVTGELTLYAKWQVVNSSGGNSSPAPAPIVENIVVDVESGNAGSGETLSTTPIKRTTNADGTIKDEVTLTMESANETIKKLQDQGNDKARIVIPDQQDKVKEVNVSVPSNVISLLKGGKIDLEILTENVRITIPKDSLGAFNDDLYFRLVPIKEEQEKNQVEERAKKESIVQEVVQNKEVKVLGRPIKIDTNMQSRPVTLVLPLKDSLPSDSEARRTILENLVIFIEHSDGTKEILRGKVVPYKDDNNELGLEFEISKFSTFTMVYMEGAQAYFDSKACDQSTLASDIIGCLNVQKTVPVYELINNRLNKVGELEKGKSVPAYEEILPMLGLGGDIWVERSSSILYETPSKSMLEKNTLTGSSRLKQIWKGLELHPGQIGKITVLKDTIIWEQINKTKKLPRILKKGEQYRVYRYVPGMYYIGEGKYVVKDGYVRIQPIK